MLVNFEEEHNTASRKQIRFVKRESTDEPNRHINRETNRESSFVDPMNTSLSSNDDNGRLSVYCSFDANETTHNPLAVEMLRWDMKREDREEEDDVDGNGGGLFTEI